MQEKLFAALSDGADSTATADITLVSFTMPRDGKVLSANVTVSTDGVQVLALQIIRGAATVDVFRREASTGLAARIATPLALLEGDIIRWRVITELAGSSAHSAIMGEYLDAD